MKMTYGELKLLLPQQVVIPSDTKWLYEVKPKTSMM